MTTCIIASPDAYQIGLLWTRDGSQALCSDCLYNVRGYCAVGRQMTPTIACYEYMHQSYEMNAQGKDE